jgi:hypothetical protein
MKNNQNTIEIQARPTRDEEGIHDSSVGIFIDIETDETEYLKLRRVFSKLISEIKRLYPPVKHEDMEIGSESRPEGRVHLILAIDFDSIKNDYLSSLFNIASLGCGVSAFLIAEEFEKLGYELRIHNNKCTASDIMRDVINDLELSFFWEVVNNSRLYSEYKSIYHDEKLLHELIQKLKFDSELYDTVKKEFIEEKEGEFGVPESNDEYIELWDYSPLRISNLASDRIQGLCKNIKYKELRDILLENKDK